MTSIGVAVISVGSCASSLIQGVFHYRDGGTTQGLIHECRKHPPHRFNDEIAGRMLCADLAENVRVAN
jgi:myo-inositol-1-phosphate synthase